MSFYNREGTIGRLEQNLPSRLTIHLQLVTKCPATEVAADTVVLP
jgi:hypothetical protein